MSNDFWVIECENLWREDKMWRACCPACKCTFSPNDTIDRMLQRLADHLFVYDGAKGCSLYEDIPEDIANVAMPCCGRIKEKPAYSRYGDHWPAAVLANHLRYTLGRESLTRHFASAVVGAGVR